MKKIVLYLILTTILFAYQKGDNVSQIANKIGINDKRIYVVDFFASWCSSCKKELPLIRKLTNNNLTIIGIDVDEDIDNAISFKKEMKLDFKVINDPNGEIVKKFNPIGFPSLYIIKNYKIVETIYGAKNDIDKVVTNIIKDIK